MIKIIHIKVYAHQDSYLKGSKQGKWETWTRGGFSTFTISYIFYIEPFVNIISEEGNKIAGEGYEGDWFLSFIIDLLPLDFVTAIQC